MAPSRSHLRDGAMCGCLSGSGEDGRNPRKGRVCQPKTVGQVMTNAEKNAL